jgi:hypothetical protein
MGRGHAKYSQPEMPYERYTLLDQSHYETVRNCILIAYTGEGRNSSDATSQYMRSFLSGANRELWLKTQYFVHTFSVALSHMRWKDAAIALRQEAQLRVQILNQKLSPLVQELKANAAQNNCGSGFGGGTRTPTFTIQPATFLSHTIPQPSRQALFPTPSPIILGVTAVGIMHMIIARR